MRILLTGATEGLGRAVAQGLLAAGHNVSGIAERAHADLDPRVDFVRASLAQPVLYELTADADAVMHLPTDLAGPRQSEVARVCDAAARTGARVIFPSLSLLEPSGWRSAEELVATGWAPSLIVRLAAPVGRQSDALVCRTIASLLRTSTADPIRVLHMDDLIRFLVLAATGPHTGTVDVGTEDTCAISQARRLIDGVDPRPRARGIASWTQLGAEMDLARIHDRWGFECGWGATDALEDTVRGLQGRTLAAGGAIAAPGRFPLPVHLVPDAGEYAGEGVGANVPVTPMSADLHLGGLRLAERQLVPLAHRSRFRIHSLARGFGRRVESYVEGFAAERLSVDAVRALRDAQLEVRIRLLRNRVHEGWMLWSAGSVLMEPRAVGSSGSIASGSIGSGVNSLAAIIRAHSYVQTMIDDGDIARARTAAPMFGSGLDRLMAAIGHRGPAEFDLSSKVFADRPELVVAAARRAMTAPLPAADQPIDPAEWLPDTTLAYTHQFRSAVRELALRLVAAEKLASVEDIFYLTVDEALAMPVDAELRIKLRIAQAERAVDSADAGVGSELWGAAVCPGLGEGTIRVIRSVDDLPVGSGEIAVISAADWSFVALMGTPAAVVVTDDGRLGGESGNVPTVSLRAGNGRLVTGMRVRVDGGSGSVAVLVEESLGELTVAR